MSVRITCINKDGGNHYNPYEAIERFGWIEEKTGKTGFCTLPVLVNYIENGDYAYVTDQFGNKAYLIVQQRNGSKYVQTWLDGKLTNNLLELGECR